MKRTTQTLAGVTFKVTETNQEGVFLGFQTADIFAEYSVANNEWQVFDYEDFERLTYRPLKIVQALGFDRIAEKYLALSC